MRVRFRHSSQAQNLHRGCLRVAIEDRVDVLHDVRAHVEEIPLVLNPQLIGRYSLSLKFEILADLFSTDYDAAMAWSIVSPEEGGAGRAA